jgi:ATP/maltotriose-dependent transcriptional regulator MalT
MPFSAKSSPPSDSGTTTVQAAFQDAAVAGSALIVAPGGYLLTEELSAALASSGRDKVWIRLGPEDRDPGTLLRSVVAAVDRCRPGTDEAGQALMRRRPGPVSGWPPLFADAAMGLATAVPTPAAMVIEHLHHLDEAESTLALLSEHLLGLLPDCLARIVVSHQQPPRAVVPPPAARYTARDLRIPSAQAGHGGAVRPWPGPGPRRAGHRSG